MAIIKMTVIGNVGADAEQRETNGRKYTTFNVAVSSKYKNQDGSETERTTWISCSRDGHSNVDQYLKKGKQIYVEGTPSVSLYTDNQGRQQCGIRLSVHTIQLLGGKDEQSQQQNQQTQKPQPQPQQQAGEYGAPF